MHSEPGRAGEGEHARGVVLHPILIDGAECTFEVLGRLRPAPAIHRQHGQLGLAVDERIGVGHGGRERGRLGEHGRGLVDVAGEQERLGVHARAPCRARRSMPAPGQPRSSRRPASAPDRRRTSPARNMARAESNEAEPSAGTRSNDAASTIAAHRSASAVCPAEHRHPAGEHGQRGVLRDGRVAERRQPTLHGGDVAGLVGRQDQRRHQLDAAVPLVGVQQVLDRHRRGSVRLVPVGGTQVQLGDDVGLDPTKLTEQELSEQAVVAVPLPPPVERDQEQARRLELAQPLLSAWFSDHGVAQRSTQLIEHRRAPQEPLVARRAAAAAPRGTGSRPRTDRHRRSSSPCRCCPWRSARRGTDRPASPRSVRSPSPPARG